MTITYSEFLQTVTENEDKVLATVAGRATFRVETSHNDVRFTPLSSGKTRTVSAQGIQGYLDVFNETQSFKTTDYSKTRRHPSYVLAIIKIWLRNKQGLKSA
jgi:hypothetical protein